jgi:O-antigen ligase
VLAARSVVYLLTLGLWAFVAAAVIVASSRERVARFLAFVLALGLLFAVYGLDIYVTYGTFRTWRGWEALGVSRAHLMFGYVAADAAVVALALTMFARLGSPLQLGAAALFALLLFFLLVSGARGALLGVGLAGLVPLLLGLRGARGRLEVSYAQLVALGAIAGALGYVGYLVASDQITQTLGRLTSALNEVQNPDLTGGFARVVYWPAALRFWAAAPVVGQGIGSFSTLLYGLEVPGTHPHNFVLQILAELGIVGLLLFGLLLWRAGRGLSRARLRADPLLLTVVFFNVTTLMIALVAKDLAGGWKVYFALGLLALRPPGGR